MHSSLDIAVVGMAGRYADSGSLDAWWQNLRSGHCAIAPARSAEYSAAKGSDEPAWGAYLEPLQARSFPDLTGDLQLRILYETAWSALEDAGYAERGRAKDTGMFVGYVYDQAPSEASAKMELAGTAMAECANRWSQWMDWRGPSLSVNSRCTSSFAALEVAIQSLQLGRCGSALVGAVQVGLDHAYFRNMRAVRLLSSSGKCAPFGIARDGYVPGEGAGALVLKRLSDAERDGNRVHGVIKACLVRHSGIGANAFGLNLDAQIDLLRRALADANAQPTDLTYVEAAAVGAALSDALEATALSRVFGGRPRTDPCVVGSLKPQYGHLEACAGIAALQKVLLAMRHEILPATKVDRVDPELGLSGEVFLSNVERSWPRGSNPRVAAISGASSHGVLAQIIVAEAAEKPSEVRAATHPRVGRSSSNRSDVAELAGQIVCIALEVAPDTDPLALEHGFLHAGLTSSQIAAITQGLEERFDRDLPTVFLFEHGSPTRAAAALLAYFNSSA